MLIRSIVGIDEVGRGCLAGPLVAAAVILKSSIPGITDSKILSEKQRYNYKDLIYENAIDIAIGWTNVDVINDKGLTYAVSNAMSMAINKVRVKYSKIIIDGNYNYLPDFDNVETVIKGDSLVQSVSAASIIAKIYRDEWITRLSLKYPQYGLEKHKGYGTKFHLEMIEKYGPTDIHRMFFKPLLKY